MPQQSLWSTIITMGIRRSLSGVGFCRDTTAELQYFGSDAKLRSIGSCCNSFYYADAGLIGCQLSCMCTCKASMIANCAATTRHHFPEQAGNLQNKNTWQQAPSHFSQQTTGYRLHHSYRSHYLTCSICSRLTQTYSSFCTVINGHAEPAALPPTLLQEAAG